MKEAHSEPFDMQKMIADYMENGLLDNIVDMFKYDKGLYAYVGNLLTDERMRVRLGATALIETLKDEDPEHVHSSLPSILPVLENQNPVYRGDAAYVLGILGHPEALDPLQKILDDENANVRLIVKEAIDDIKASLPAGQ